jgi:hypothetical protein
MCGGHKASLAIIGRSLSLSQRSPEKNTFVQRDLRSERRTKAGQ